MSCSFPFLLRHAGLDPASRAYLEDWIPAFAGMTVLNVGPNSSHYTKITVKGTGFTVYKTMHSGL